MLFSSITFIYVFLPIVLFVYYVILKKFRKLQNVFLLFSSLFFYAWGEPKFVLIMIGSIIVNWLFGIIISKIQTKIALRRVVLFLDIAFNLSILFVFKYLNFTCNVLNHFFQLKTNIPHIALPIGISFFTFQAMSYVIDVYRGKGKVQKNILNVGLYITLFPQLIAGPIVRYETIENEIENRKESLEDFGEGFARFIIGLSKKVLLANSFAIIADEAFGIKLLGGGETLGSITVLHSWIGAIGYTLQIFFDFSGYSDMAIGLGKMFGFHFHENFNYPYISTSISEFWRRWHISLGSWFRDYVYIPLGGSRRGIIRTLTNLFIVWLCTGIWHGANYTFIVWGLMYFVLISLEKLVSLFKEKNTEKIIYIKWMYTMFFVITGWVIFRSESISYALAYIKSMFHLNGNLLLDNASINILKHNTIILLLGVFFSTPLFKRFKEYLDKANKNKVILNCTKAALLICLFILSISSIASSSYNPFIYFNF